MAVHCPNCGGNFSDNKSYQDHLPCRVRGGREDISKGGAAQETEGGTGGGRP